MDAQKVMDEDWYQDERIHYPFLQGFVECITKVFNRRCSLKWGQRSKDNKGFPLGVYTLDVVLAILEGSSKVFILDVAEQDSMEL